MPLLRHWLHAHPEDMWQELTEFLYIFLRDFWRSDRR